VYGIRWDGEGGFGSIVWVGIIYLFRLRIFSIMSDGNFAYVREESGRVGIIDYIRRIAMMSEENKTYT